MRLYFALLLARLAASLVSPDTGFRPRNVTGLDYNLYAVVGS